MEGKFFFFLKLTSYPEFLPPTHYIFFENTVVIVTPSIIIRICLNLFKVTHLWTFKLFPFGGGGREVPPALKRILTKEWAPRGGQPV